ncbi:MAG TPA: DUF2239 family protein [Holophagaceae bacterium]
MDETRAQTCTAFQGSRRLTSGLLHAVALAVKAAHDGNPTAPLLTFDDATGRVIDLDLRGTAEEVAARYAPGPVTAAAPRGRGRPKLGVVAREVTLLPRHWEWLNTQPGGASVALRRLVEQARQADEGPAGRRAAQEAAYRFMSALAGDAPGYEEALRALFAGDRPAFTACLSPWPADVREHALRLAAPALPAVPEEPHA